VSEQIDNLSDGLGERIRVLRDGDAADGHFVLYWMHHAVRGHENPALTAAIEAGNRLGLPVLVYQGLAGKHRFNSDRHHTFILEGARDAAAEIADLGVRYVFCLPADPAEPGPLPALWKRAALVVCEEFPAPPLPEWTERLAERGGRPVWSVDAACVVPMRLHEESYERAFKFRKKAWKKFKQRVEWRVPESAAEAPMFEGDLGFEPVDFQAIDIPDAVAACDIDHTVAPVPHTVGGSRAGYERWEAFLESGIRGYHKRRNNADIDGVSRMSAYLHHGHVSPFRLARDAWAEGGDGAEKYIDELFVWRELAHNLCFHRHADVESSAVLPDWAVSTLRAHASDPRPKDLSWESLARARSGDRLWDAAQRSLLIHGELHNNVRMTWAKAIPFWSRGPGEALHRLIDLNHRYALDGNDPNSYGGLLWTLGFADRPFGPEQSVLGTVRPRPTDEHARRMDLDAYEKATAAPARPGRERVAVVGGGIAGSIAARTLADHGLEVHVFDKGRGPGGRMSTRREGELRFDHGAQYFTARTELLSRLSESWKRDGVAAEWDARFATIDDQGITAAPDKARLVGTPGMSEIVRHLQAGATVSFGRRVERINRRPGSWSLEFEDGDGADRFDRVVVALPSTQAAELLAEPAPVFAQRAADAVVRPCWTLMVAFDGRLPVEYDGAFVRTDSPIGWLAREGSKPGRPEAARHAWTVQAGPEWSEANLELDRDEAAEKLMEALRELVGSDLPGVVHCAAHRWRYAMVTDAAGEACLFEPDRSLVVCGDWLLGGRVEAGFTSGAAAAGRLLGMPVARDAGLFGAAVGAES